jgi:hypothetical protein
MFLVSSSDTEATVETRVNILVKNPEILLLEDQRNANSNCLVLNVSNRVFKKGLFLLKFS